MTHPLVNPQLGSSKPLLAATEHELAKALCRDTRHKLAAAARAHRAAVRHAISTTSHATHADALVARDQARDYHSQFEGALRAAEDFEAEVRSTLPLSPLWFAIASCDPPDLSSPLLALA